ncbi:oligopeptide/dipeptide ABC transporter ATP-binding protein [Mesorhizobium sp. AA22]|uniref:oligopeptide/dipeptide ABC transporter ATP-binding protein n=3 Tax=unclassified Mesorhizobium TaxID=325217 RepID=UPI0032B2CAD6
MYLGSIVESGPTDLVFAAPRHHYTAALRSAVPIPSVDRARHGRLVLKDDLPSPMNPPSGCRFHTRCPASTSTCRNERPLLQSTGDGRLVACHHPGGG